MDRSAAGEPASQALRHSPIPALRQLRVEENERRLVVSGELPSFYYKQLAQETLMPLLAGRELVNQVQVVSRNS